jgi:hypothetical protein
MVGLVSEVPSVCIISGCLLCFLFTQLLVSLFFIHMFMRTLPQWQIRNQIRLRFPQRGHSHQLSFARKKKTQIMCNKLNLNICVFLKYRTEQNKKLSLSWAHVSITGSAAWYFRGLLIIRTFENSLTVLFRVKRTPTVLCRKCVTFPII